MKIFKIQIKNSLRFYQFLFIFAILVISYLFYDNKSLRYSKINRNRIKYLFISKTIISDNEYLNIVNPTQKQHSFLQGSLHSGEYKLMMYLHHRRDLISSYILSTNRWETDLLQQFEDYIKNHPGIQVLDVGCNLGVYTLAAAALGSNVVAVDANPNNTIRVVQSLLDNGFQERGIVCLNAMSNERKNYELTLVVNNVGGSNIMETISSSKSVKTIFMDDLLPFFDGDREIALKIDIEGNEIAAFLKASKFFDERNVVFIMMEWVHIKKLYNIKYVIDFLHKRHFKPYTNCQKTQELKLEEYIAWPYDMFWLK